MQVTYAGAIKLCDAMQGKNPGSSADPWPCTANCAIEMPSLFGFFY